MIRSSAHSDDINFILGVSSMATMNHGDSEAPDEGPAWIGPSVADQRLEIWTLQTVDIRRLLNHIKRLAERPSGGRDRNVRSPMTRVQSGDGGDPREGSSTPADFEARKDTSSGGSHRVLSRRSESSEIKE